MNQSDRRHVVVDRFSVWSCLQLRMYLIHTFLMNQIWYSRIDSTGLNYMLSNVAFLDYIAKHFYNVITLVIIVQYCDMNPQDIKDLDEFRAKNQRLLKLWVGRLLFYSSALYLITCLCVYYLYFPEQWSARLITALPLLAFPALWVLYFIHDSNIALGLLIVITSVLYHIYMYCIVLNSFLKAVWLIGYCVALLVC